MVSPCTNNAVSDSRSLEQVFIAAEMPWDMGMQVKRWRRFMLALWLQATVGKKTLPMLKTIQNKLGTYLRHCTWDEGDKGLKKGKGKGKKGGPKGNIADDDEFDQEASRNISDDDEFEWAASEMVTFPPTPSGVTMYKQGCAIWDDSLLFTLTEDDIDEKLSPRCSIELCDAMCNTLFLSSARARNGHFPSWSAWSEDLYDDEDAPSSNVVDKAFTESVARVMQKRMVNLAKGDGDRKSISSEKRCRQRARAKARAQKSSFNP